MKPYKGHFNQRPVWGHRLSHRQGLVSAEQLLGTAELCPTLGNTNLKFQSRNRWSVNPQWPVPHPVPLGLTSRPLCSYNLRCADKCHFYGGHHRTANTEDDSTSTALALPLHGASSSWIQVWHSKSECKSWLVPKSTSPPLCHLNDSFSSPGTTWDLSVTLGKWS